MYINTETMIAILIALGTSMLTIMLSYNAHKKLLRKYEIAKSTIVFLNKERDEYYVKVPF